MTLFHTGAVVSTVMLFKAGAHAAKPMSNADELTAVFSCHHVMLASWRLASTQNLAIL
jgi:hypothetical protein